MPYINFSVHNTERGETAAKAYWAHEKYEVSKGLFYIASEV